MSDDIRLERLLDDVLVTVAPPRAPARLRLDINTTTGQTRQRPRWLALIKERPMRLDTKVAVGSPAVRLASITALTLALVLALGAAVAIGASLLPSPATLIPPDHGVFTPTGSMSFGRENPTATLLRDGRVLVVGGYGGELNGNGDFPHGTDVLSSAEVWDPRTEVFSLAGTLLAARDGSTATLVQDGHVLITGGSSSDGGPLISAEIGTRRL